MFVLSQRMQVKLNCTNLILLFLMKGTKNRTVCFGCLPCPFVFSFWTLKAAFNLVSRQRMGNWHGNRKHTLKLTLNSGEDLKGSVTSNFYRKVKIRNTAKTIVYIIFRLFVFF